MRKVLLFTFSSWIFKGLYFYRYIYMRAKNLVNKAIFEGNVSIRRFWLLLLTTLFNKCLSQLVFDNSFFTTILGDNFGRPFLTTIVVDSFWKQLFFKNPFCQPFLNFLFTTLFSNPFWLLSLTTVFDDKFDDRFWQPFLTTVFENSFWKQFLKIVLTTIFDNSTLRDGKSIQDSTRKTSRLKN